MQRGKKMDERMVRVIWPDGMRCNGTERWESAETIIGWAADLLLTDGEDASDVCLEEAMEILYDAGVATLGEVR